MPTSARHRAAVEPTTPDGRLVAAASERLGIDAAVATAIGLSRTQLSRVRGGVAELSEYRRVALRAVAAGEPVPPRPARQRVTIALTDDEADRLWSMAADQVQPLSAVLSEAILDWLGARTEAPTSATAGRRRAPPGTRWRSYRVEPAVLAALLARIGTASPGQALRKAVLKKIDRRPKKEVALSDIAT